MENTSVHISLTFSRTMLQCLSKALTRPRSFLLLRQLMRTCLHNENVIELEIQSLTRDVTTKTKTVSKYNLGIIFDTHHQNGKWSSIKLLFLILRALQQSSWIRTTRFYLAEQKQTNCLPVYYQIMKIHIYRDRSHDKVKNDNLNRELQLSKIRNN